MAQKITSAKTALHQLSAGFKLVDKHIGWEHLSQMNKEVTHVDIGSGPYLLGYDFIQSFGINSLRYDPYNIPQEENEIALKALKKRVDIITAFNVLNVIKGYNNRLQVIELCAKGLKEKGVAFFTVYEGNSTGEGQLTSKGWQENRKTDTYIKEIQNYFKYVIKTGKLIIANNYIYLIEESPSFTKKGKFPVGKEVGGKIYIHKSALYTLPENIHKYLKDRINILNNLGIKDYDIISFDLKGNISLNKLYGWDTLSEPILLSSITFSINGAIKIFDFSTRENKIIYHHKWMMVDSNYKGFDVKKEKAWSKYWETHPFVLELKRKKDEKFKNRIGYQNYWSWVTSKSICVLSKQK